MAYRTDRHARLRSRWCLALFALVFSCGCQHFQVAVSSSGAAPVFQIGKGRKPVALGSLEVRDESTGRPPAVMWSIRTSKQGRVQTVGEVTYGVVPTGFEERCPAAPLVSGRTYVVGVLFGDYGAQKEFVAE